MRIGGEGVILGSALACTWPSSGTVHGRAQSTGADGDRARSAGGAAVAVEVREPTTPGRVHRPCGDAVAVTYLANAAVLLRGEARVLIDGPFTTGVEPYPRFRPGTLLAARTADPPFSDLDWILPTHAHADHMDAGVIVEHLRSNPRARVASTPEAIDRIRRESGDDPAVAGRLIAVDPAEGRPTLVHAGTPRIEALVLHHGRRREIVNVGFLVEMDGVRFLHVGDSEATASDLRPLSLPGHALDAAFVPTWYFTSAAYRPALDEIAARTTLVVHFPAPEFDGGFVRRLGGWPGVRRFLERFDPPPVPLLERGVTVCIAAGDARNEPGQRRPGRVRGAALTPRATPPWDRRGSPGPPRSAPGGCGP